MVEFAKGDRVKIKERHDNGAKNLYELGEGSIVEPTIKGASHLCRILFDKQPPVEFSPDNPTFVLKSWVVTI